MLIDRATDALLCQYCGEWHYGRGESMAEASKQAQNAEATCGSSRKAAGLPDEPPYAPLMVAGAE